MPGKCIIDGVKQDIGIDVELPLKRLFHLPRKDTYRNSQHPPYPSGTLAATKAYRSTTTRSSDNSHREQ